MEANAMEITPAAVATAAPADPVMSETNTLNGAPGATTAATSGTGTAVIAALDKSGTPAVLMPIVKHSITEELCELLRICTEACPSISQTCWTAHGESRMLQSLYQSL